MSIPDPTQRPNDPLANLEREFELSNAIPGLIKGLWWMVLLRGIFAIVFGVVALFAPSAAVIFFAVVFGAYAVISGIGEIVQSLQLRSLAEGWGWLLFQGVVSLIAGLAALIFPGTVGVIGGIFVLWIVAIFALIHGVSGLISASGISGAGRTLGVVVAAISLVFGIVLSVLLFTTPVSSVFALVWVIAIYALVYGLLIVVASLLLRRSMS